MSRATAAAAKARVADNADRVAALNGQPELVLTVAARGDYHLLAHRPSCKRIIVTKTVEQPTQHDPVEPAGCCKPNPELVQSVVARLSERQGRPAAADAAEPTSAQPDVRTPKGSAKLHDRVRDVPTDDPAATADPDPHRRADLAKAEWKALHAWAKAGEQPPRPATPNLDALNAEYAAGVTATERRRQAKSNGKGTTPRTRTGSTNERVAAARAAAAAGARGKGRPITDEELAAWIKAERAADPTVTRFQAQQINWWVDGYACGIGRFNKAWDALTA